MNVWTYPGWLWISWFSERTFDVGAGLYSSVSWGTFWARFALEGMTGEHPRAVSALRRSSESYSGNLESERLLDGRAQLAGGDAIVERCHRTRARCLAQALS